MRLRLILVLVFQCLVLTQTYAQNNGVNWEVYSNWNAVLKIAQERKRPIFLDLYATWCGPCKWMDKEVYIKDSVGEFFNREFISVKVQMDSLPWDEAKIKSWYSSVQQLRNTYDVKSFPTLLFLSPKGEIYQKIEGVRDAESLLREAKDALDPKKQYATNLRAYESGNRDPEFVRSLVRTTNWNFDKIRARKMAQEYIVGLSEKEMLTKDNAWFIYEFTKRSTDPGFAFLRDKQKEIEQVDGKLGKKFTESTVNMIIRFEAIEPFRKDNNGKANWILINENLKPFGAAGQKALKWVKPDIFFNDQFQYFLNGNPDWSVIQKKVGGYKFNRKETIRLFENILYHSRNLFLKEQVKNDKTLISVANYYFSQPDVDLKKGIDHLANDFAWFAFGSFKDKAGLIAALKWSERAMADEPESVENVDTYANLLYKLGMKEEAIKWEEKALKLSPDNEGIKENYNKMKAGSKTWKE